MVGGTVACGWHVVASSSLSLTAVVGTCGGAGVLWLLPLVRTLTV